MIDPQQTVASLVLDHSECAEVFQRHHIDFCCRGEQAIAAAASARGVAVDALVDELALAIATRLGDREADPRALSTPRLVAHIVSRHHEYLRRALPFVVSLSEKVARVHGDRDPRLRDLAHAVDALSTSLLPHLDDEEASLFPMLSTRQVDTAAVAPLLRAMLDEHLAVAALLEQARLASADYTLPEWACRSYRTLFAELQQLERDVFTHVHLENHVLRPRYAAS